MLAAEPRPWQEAGFRVEGEGLRVGQVRFRFGENGPRLRWALRHAASLDLDGLPTQSSDDPVPESAPVHPNGVERLDHIVAFSGHLDRTVATLRAAGLDFRRVREGPTPSASTRQAFFRLGEAILEVVEHPPGPPAAADPDAPSRFYGLAFLVQDIEAAAGVLGDRLGQVRDAVQPGRRIATVRREAGLGLPVALMTPDVKRDG